MNRIRNLSTFAMLVLAPVLIYYPIEAMSWILDLSFLDPERWTRNDRWVHPEARIALSTRIVFFLVWTIPTILGFLAYLFGFLTLYKLRKGVVFDHAIARGLTRMGILIFASSTLSLLAGAVSPMIRSWHNPDGPLPLRFWYSSGNIGLALCGLAFLFMGLVLHEAIRIARENEEFV